MLYVLARSWGRVTAGARIRGVVLAFAFLSFANFIVADSLAHDLYGGEIGLGKVENGHYFVRDRSRYFEVPERFFLRAAIYEKASRYSFASSAGAAGLCVLWGVRSRRDRSGRVAGDA